MSTAKTYQEARMDARNAAEDVLKRYWPHQSLPVDPVKIARALGISVFDTQLGNDTWGMIIGSESGADIYLDRDQPASRYRFSCAHEIGHFIDRANSLDPGMGYVDKRSTQGVGNMDEFYANEFAASVLMPESQFRKYAKLGKSAFELSEIFGVSLQATRLRAEKLGISLGLAVN